MLCLFEDFQVLSDDGDGGTTWRMRLPPTTWASGGQRCWTFWADRRIPHNCKVSSWSYTPISCTANYNPSDFCAILMLTSYAKKGNEMLCFDLFSSTSRLGGEEARQFLPAVEQHFSRLGKVILVSFYVFGVIKSRIWFLSNQMMLFLMSCIICRLTLPVLV